jgi:hypothetical protein
VRRLLLKNGNKLDPKSRWALRTWLASYPALRELYEAKEALSAFYRIRSHEQASRVLTALTDRLASSSLPEIKTFRSTLLRWRKEILAYFRTRSTNGMTEGFNGKAKLVKRRAYGYKSFTNYRLRLLTLLRQKFFHVALDVLHRPRDARGRRALGSGVRSMGAAVPGRIRPQRAKALGAGVRARTHRAR